jgi:hypothetical protein
MEALLSARSGREHAVAPATTSALAVRIRSARLKIGTYIDLSSI